MSEFYQVTPTIAQVLRKANLTASEWKIWSYLVEVDPWGSRYEKVDTLEVMASCNVSKATYYRAIGKFQEEKIFDFQDNGFNVRNLHGVRSLKNEKTVSEMRQTVKISDSQNCENSLRIETKVSEMRQLSQDCEKRGSKVAPSNDSGTPQISSDYSEDPKDRSDDFVFFENANSENSQVAIASQNPKLDDADKRDLKPVDEIKPTKTPEEALNPIGEDPFRRQLEDFVISFLKIEISDEKRPAYFKKFSNADWEKWEVKFKPPTLPIIGTNIFVPEVVEIPDPDSPKVKEAIAQIKAALGIREKSKCS